MIRLKCLKTNSYYGKHESQFMQVVSYLLDKTKLTKQPQSSSASMNPQNTLPLEQSPIVGIYASISTVCVFLLDLYVAMSLGSSVFPWVYWAGTACLSFRFKRYFSLGTFFIHTVFFMTTMIAMLLIPLLCSLALLALRFSYWVIRNGRNGRYHYNMVLLTLLLMLMSPNTVGFVSQHCLSMLAFAPKREPQRRRSPARTPVTRATMIQPENCCLLATLSRLYPESQFRQLVDPKGNFAKDLSAKEHQGNVIFGASPPVALAALACARKLVRSAEPVMFVVLDPEAKKVYCVAEVKQNVVQLCYRRCNLTCQVMVFATQTGRWLRFFDTTVDDTFTGGHIFLAQDIQLLLQKLDFEVSYSYLGETQRARDAFSKLVFERMQRYISWPNTSQPMVSDAMITNSAPAPQVQVEAEQDSAPIPPESRLRTYVEVARAVPPPPSPLNQQEESTATTQFMVSRSCHTQYQARLTIRPRETTRSTLQLRYHEQVDAQHLEEEQPTPVEELAEAPISTAITMAEYRLQRLRDVYGHRARLVDGLPYVDLQTFDEMRQPEDRTYEIGAPQPHRSITDPIDYPALYGLFETRIPMVQQDDAFAPLAMIFPVYILGVALPYVVSRVVAPVLRVLKMPNSSIPLLHNVAVNLSGVVVPCRLASPPDIRTSVLNGEHILIAGPATPPNYFSNICRNWHWYRLLMSRTVAPFTKATYLAVKFFTPHWALTDDRLVNRHEFNMQWAAPAQTPALLSLPGVTFYLLFRPLVTATKVWIKEILRNTSVVWKLTQQYQAALWETLADRVPLKSNIGYGAAMRTLDRSEIRWFRAHSAAPLRFFVKWTSRYNSLLQTWFPSSRLLAGSRKVQERVFDSLLSITSSRTLDQLVADVTTGKYTPPPQRFTRLEVAQLKVACGIRPNKVPVVGEVRLGQIQLTLKVTGKTVKKFFREARRGVDFSYARNTTWQLLKRNKYAVLIAATVTLVAVAAACLRRKGSYFYQDRSAERVCFYGCGPCNPSLSYVLANTSGKRNLHMIPYPMAPALLNNKVIKRVNIRGVTCNYVPMELTDQPEVFSSHPYTYYWKQVGHATDPVTLTALHVVEAAMTSGDVDCPPIMQSELLLALRGLPPPQVVNVVPAPPALPEQYYHFHYFDVAVAVMRVAIVKTIDFQNKLSLLETLLIGRKIDEEAIKKAQAGDYSSIQKAMNERFARLSNAIGFASCGTTLAHTGAGEKVVHEYLLESLMARVSQLRVTHQLRMPTNFQLNKQLKEVETEKFNPLDLEVDHHTYALAFAPFKYGQLERENLREGRIKTKNKRRKKPAGRALDPCSLEERAGVDFRCRACDRAPPKKFRWYWQMCPECYEDMKTDAIDDPYYDPEVTAPFPEGVQKLGPPNRIKPVQPKFKEKNTVPNYQQNFKLSRQRDAGILPIDRARGPQAVGVVTNVRCTVYNALGAGNDHFGPGEPGLVRNRIFKAPTYVATALAWQTARQNLYHPNSFLMQRLAKWKEGQENATIQPYRFSDPKSTQHAIDNGWTTPELAAEIERYLDEFDSHHSTSHECNKYQEGRGWVHSFEPARQAEIWEEAAELVTNGINKNHARCKLFMKMEKAPNCADFGDRVAANPRCIISFSNITQLLAGRYTRSVTTLLHEMFSPNERFSYAGGMTPMQMDAWLEQEVDQATMQLVRDVVIAMSDYAAFDTTQRKVVLDFWHQFLSHIGVPIFPTRSNLDLADSDRPFPSSHEYLGWIFKTWSRPVGKTTRLNKLKGPFMNCSGRGDTAAMNFFLNFSTQYLAYLIVMTGHYGPYSPEEYAYVNDNIRFVALGDDSLVFVPRLKMDNTPWHFGELQTAVSFFGFEFSEGKVTTDPRDIIFLGMRPWPAKEVVSEENGKLMVVDVVAWAPVLGRYLQKMGWRLDSSGDPYAWWKGIAKAAKVCFPHLQIVNDIADRTQFVLSHHTQSPIWNREMRDSQYKLYYVERDVRLLPDDDRAIPLLHHLYNIDRSELDVIRSDISSITTFPVVLSNYWLERAMKREAS